MSKTWVWKRFPPQHETADKAHGRIEIRRIWASAELQGYLDFPHHRQVVRLERITTDLQGRPRRQETAFAITSCAPEQFAPQRLLAISRGHWAIENGLHWVRDVTFDEDRSQIRTRSGPQVMASLRNLAVSLLRLRGVTSIAKALRHYAAKPSQTLSLIGL